MHHKRKRSDIDSASRSTTLKRCRHTASPDLLSPLSDELLLRILTLLPLSDLLHTAPVSRRFYTLSADSQIWKRLYYSRFVLPRALRIPGFRDGSAKDGKLHYSSHRTIWVDGRRGGLVEMRSGEEDKRSRDWKRQYRLRHNWSRGKCAVEELRVRGDSELRGTDHSHKMLVKVSDGLAITADVETGLRAWDLKTKQLIVEASLNEVGSTSVPSCIAVDDQNHPDQALDIAIGFTDGSFGIWKLYIRERRILRRYRHEKSSNGDLIGVAFSYPYLLTATKSVLISLYTFDGPPKTERPPSTTRTESETGQDPESESVRESTSPPEHEHTLDKPILGTRESKTRSGAALRAPYLLTSLKSHTSRAPLALSIRRTAGNIVASIAYAFSTLQGWSLGIQDLHLRPSDSNSKPAPEVISTRLAYTLPVRPVPTNIPSPPTSPTRRASSSISTPSTSDDLEGPISLCYTHPYLLVTLPDNTLILYLCTSTASSLSISPGIRLWGHTSGISDAEITARGKAVSVSCRGEEIRVWELEGTANGRSIEVRPTAKPVVDAFDGPGSRNSSTMIQWDERRNWVGFDDEMVIVLKESKDRESLMVYDFT